MALNKKPSASDFMTTFSQDLESKIQQEKSGIIPSEEENNKKEPNNEKVGETKPTPEREEEEATHEDATEGKKNLAELFAENKDLLELICKYNLEPYKDQKRLPGVLFKRNHDILSKLANAKDTSLENLANNIIHYFIEGNKKAIVKILKESSKIDL